MLAPDSAPDADLPLLGVTLLLVEDSRLTSDVLRMFSARTGARLRRAETLEQARRHLSLYRPDVVIVDLGLPDGRGEVLINTLSQSGALVIGTSADPLGRQAAMAAGAVDFLEKPLRGIAAFQSLILAHLPPLAPARRRANAGRAAGFMAGAEAWGGGIDVDWADDLGANLPEIGGKAGGWIADRAAPGAAEPVPSDVVIDPLALADDLCHAADALGHLAASPRDDASARTYLAGFVSGIARATNDAELTACADAAHLGRDALPPLIAAIEERLKTARAL